MAEPAPNEKSRLQEHFADGGVDSGSKWAELWNTNFTPWDRGLPNPALEDLLQDRSDLIGSCWRINEAGVRQRRTAFVPACGKGYDVLLFASYGFDAYGLEISGAAVEECRKVQAQESDKYPERDHESGTGKVEYILGDFFSESWLEKVEGDKTFDLIYDYTFFCAISPSRRPQWSSRMKDLLHPAGRLICLEFPLYKDPAIAGPPHGLNHETYQAHLANPGDKLAYDDRGYANSQSVESQKPNSIKLLEYWKPKRTHKIGEGSDIISVWTHR